MSLLYNVPNVKQQSNNTCWHASASMIWFYWQSVTRRQGPMNTLSEKYSQDQALYPEEFIDLAKTVGMLEVVKAHQHHHHFSAAELEGMLKKYGPLWCAGNWYGQNHIIVLTGIHGHTISINDPWKGIHETYDVNWFNAHLAKQYNGCLMHKNPDAY